MRIDLCLKHFDFQIPFFFFAFYSGFQKVGDPVGHLIDLFSYASDLVVCLYGTVRIEISPGYEFQTFFQAADGST